MEQTCAYIHIISSPINMYLHRFTLAITSKMTAYTDCQSQPTVLGVFLSIGLMEARASFFVPAHPLPLALPSPLKPDGHVQVKLS